jgi:hypothetical protein
VEDELAAAAALVGTLERHQDEARAKEREWRERAELAGTTGKCSHADQVAMRFAIAANKLEYAADHARKFPGALKVTQSLAREAERTFDDALKFQSHKK